MKNEIFLGTPSNVSDLGGFTTAVTMGQGWPTQHTVKVGNVDKQIPITYLDKDVIEEGEYVHPKTGQKVHASRQQLKDWKKKFDEMARTGALEPTIPCDHRVGSKDNLGFVKAARLHEVTDAKGKKKLRLNLTHALIGEDAPVLALRNRASLGIDPDFTDGKGKNWGSVIIHSAITPDPVVSGMGGFASTTMLSRGQQVESMYLLSALESNMKAEHKSMLCKHLGMEPSDSMSDDDLMSMVDKEMTNRDADMKTMATGVKTMARAAGATGTDFESTVEAATEAITLTREKADAVVTLSRENPELDDDTAFLLANSFNTEREAALATGGCDEATAKEFDRFLMAEGKPTRVALSRHSETDKTPFASLVWRALKNNKPVPVNGVDKTGTQYLHRTTPNAGSDADTKKKVRDEMIAKANGKARK